MNDDDPFHSSEWKPTPVQPSRYPIPDNIGTVVTHTIHGESPMEKVLQPNLDLLKEAVRVMENVPDNEFDITDVHEIQEVHHDNCIGADEQFSSIVIDIFYDYNDFEDDEPRPREIAHPTYFPSMQNQNSLADVILDPKPPLERNKDIVNVCDILLAAPKGPEEQRSGTWSTVRYARKVGKPVVIFWPNGEVEESNFTRENS